MVWNASCPKTETLNAMVRINGGDWMPVCPNANTARPDYLNFDWSAIETNSEIVTIMADGGEKQEWLSTGKHLT